VSQDAGIGYELIVVDESATGQSARSLSRIPGPVVLERPLVVTSTAAGGMYLANEESTMIADDPASFADAVVWLWTNKILWERISVSGRAVFAKISQSRQLPGESTSC
jgi:hypothetical protein